MATLVRQMMATGASGLPQGFARLLIRGDELVDEMAQLVISRTGAQGGPEYLRAYNAMGGADVDASEALQYRWGADEGRIVPYAARLDGSDLVLDLGRNVNALLDQQSNYRIVLIQNGRPVPRECTLAWTRVAPVRPGDLASFVPRPDTARPAPPADGGKAAPPPAPPFKAPAPPTKELPPLVDPSPPTPVRSRWLLPAIAAGVLLVIAAGVAGYWFLWRDKEDKTVQVPPEKPSPTDKKETDKKETDKKQIDPPPEPPPKAAPTETREQRLARVIAQGPDAAIEAGRQAQAGREIDEAAFLFGNACDRGSAEGCRLAAQLYDPLDLAAGRATQRQPADARQAVSLYRRAMTAGSVEAEKDLARLRIVIERAANDGDSAAKVLLETWPRKP